MLSNWEMIGRLTGAAILGGAIGFERERLSWAAGLRTHMLVSVGSCLMILVSAYGFSNIMQADHVVLDPSRIAAQVVSGIGFLGAGSIILRNEVVRGLTTAASVWAVAGVGLAMGGGMYIPATAATLIILLILAGIKPLEERYRANRQSHQIVLDAERGVLTLHVLHDVLGPEAGRVRQFVVERHEEDDNLDQIRITFSRVTTGQYRKSVEALRKLRGVTVRD
ncbi:methyltransferase [Robbsia andropogonis]|uniref:Protein MgtC n=1 Tax=Robbsia andropogonis TaxID=28092 RepID=A0A0F5K7B7_9BURK|nr:MgtC/SapB family protein [Robbsia andropogonis]KKB65427.1 methyltransferase [Robbsia andropogonis]MCP1117209.1 MgtC/SapB family protein [Robbsia andropogonis]MCP1128555.1 MgtC/SapB family protein [Robbsia andropogonis]